MISLFPTHTETIVCGDAPQDVLSRLNIALEEGPRPTGRHFTGSISKSHFILTVRLRRAQLFMPVIIGEVESTSQGSIVFLRYRLFPATRLLLGFWSFILPVAFGFIAYHYNNINLLLGGLAFLALVHAVAWANFHLHVKTSQQILRPILGLN